jgi:hypothetical protein
MESLKKEESCGNKDMIILYNMYKNIFVKIVSSYFRVLVYIQTPVENLPDFRDRSVTGIF